MNTSQQSFQCLWQRHHSSLAVTLLALLTSSCTMYAGDHKVIVEDYSQPAVSAPSGFPDPVLKDGMYEARVDSNICIKFASEKKCTW